MAPIHMLNRLSIWLLIGLLGIMPALLLSTSSGGSAAYYLILAAGVLCALTMRGGRVALLQPYVPVLIAFSLPLLAMAWSAFMLDAWGEVNFERGLRLALGAPLLLLAMLHARQSLHHALWGPLAAGWVAACSVVALIYPDLSQRPLTQYYNAVGYGNLMLLMAALSMLSLPFRLTRFPRAEMAFKLLTSAATFAGFVLTQTRSGWMALPVFIVLAIVLYARLRHPVRLGGAVLAVLVGLVAIGASNPQLRDRVALGINQTTQCFTSNDQANTSICVRVQLWRSALDMAQAQPFTGVGSGEAFKAQLRRFNDERLISQYVASNYGEPHNDLLDSLALHGIPGGIALLLLYLVPTIEFVRRLRPDLPQTVRAAAAMGIATCLGFAIFGLTEMMFRGMRTLGFYVVLVTLFLALSDWHRSSRSEPPV